MMKLLKLSPIYIANVLFGCAIGWEFLSHNIASALVTLGGVLIVNVFAILVVLKPEASK